MADPVSHALREAAIHRGYRLQRSRKKTPGAGDYGKTGFEETCYRFAKTLSKSSRKARA
jgi:hypothetical protein